MTFPTREMTASDRAFVASTWVNASRYCGGIERSRRSKATNLLVDRVLATSPRVLCVATDERTVHAWAAASGDILLFAYTAPELRRKGFARHLMRELFGSTGPKITAHECPSGLAPNAHHNPHSLSLVLAEAA